MNLSSRQIKSFIRSHVPGTLYEAAATAKAATLHAIWPRTYQEMQIARAAQECRVAGARVLVVGASTGEDCKLFIERGASEVHGLDLREDVGRNFQHQRAIYHRGNIERADLPSRYFDLTFAVATFEHVHNIESGFAEMARLTKTGGMLYSFAAPLWQSRYGHHMAGFEDHPWAHLAFDQEGLINYGKTHNLPSVQSNDTLEQAVSYMFGRDHFNRRPGAEYTAACARITGITIRSNALFREPRRLLEHPLAKIAIERGYDPDEMLSTSHTLVAVAN